MGRTRIVQVVFEGPLDVLGRVPAFQGFGFWVQGLVVGV